ncbi:hypothetical protein OJF2_65390 [Aquisphaera giovannonii]|uniref:DUF4440 domain-containing protein n=1 Tax=Aquisphaera giovannonii TaxID=406548 RepID=A0A5B9WBU4_9BACT|nr:hypothetical protein [Aquisphaera giovannonii]QEH37943.1 hypothetical protein OJF2_65390 [Aquisphaera giovannonii]
MRHIRLAALTACLALMLTTSRLPAAGQDRDKPADEATALAVKLTTEGAALFDTMNAKAMADTYTEEGEIVMTLRGGDGNKKTERYVGRPEVEKHYGKLFEKPQTIKSRNHVEYAKLVAPDMLVIAGTFDVNTLQSDSPKVPFYQVRVKEGDKWLVSSMRIIVVLK